MAFCPRFVIREFTAENRAMSGRVLRLMLDALVGIDMYELAAHPEWPGLYESGTTYVRDEKGVEDWQDCGEVLRRRKADCKSLVAYRVAELRIRHGIPAMAQYLWKDRPDGGSLYHIQVQYPDGTIEDPSRKLGMASVSGY
jgi:hypothetical protein